jgi:hypothetical protein
MRVWVLLLLIFVIFIGILFFISLLGWFFVPSIIRWRYAPRNHASFHPKYCEKYPTSSEKNWQKNPFLILDSQNQTYRIKFGNNRVFSNGKIEINWHGKIYSSFPTKNQEKLVLKKEDQEEIQHPLGSAEIIAWKWQIRQKKNNPILLPNLLGFLKKIFFYLKCMLQMESKK